MKCPYPYLWNAIAIRTTRIPALLVTTRVSQTCNMIATTPCASMPVVADLSISLVVGAPMSAVPSLCHLLPEAARYWSDREWTCIHSACRYERSTHFAANHILVAARCPWLPPQMTDTCSARPSLSFALVCLMHRIEMKASIEAPSAWALVAGGQRSGTLIICENDKVYVVRPASMMNDKLKVSYFALLVPLSWLCLWRLP